MKTFLMSAVAVLAVVNLTQAEAKETVLPDFDIIAVAPRSPDVKPYVMSLPAEGRTHADRVAKTTEKAPAGEAPKPARVATAEQK